MKAPTEQQAIYNTIERLAELTGTGCQELPLRPGSSVDALLQAAPLLFVVEWKSDGSPGLVATAIEQVRRCAAEMERDRHADDVGAIPFGSVIVPLVVTPFMGEAGRQLCAERDVGWLDFSGNARIYTQGLKILIDGKPNKYKRRGRPASAFAPKSSRIARWLLMHPTECFTQRQLSQATGMDEGHTSRLVGKLKDDGLIVRDNEQRIRARDPNLLLDAWLKDYKFSKHHFVRGHIPARSGEGLLRELSADLDRASVPYAATGLASAWSLGRFAGFRVVSLYLQQTPSPGLLAAMPFHEDDRGANLWLITPNDEGVFQGAAAYDGIRCVHPVQTYLDLHAHPERAKDIAREFRREHLQWRTDD